MISRSSKGCAVAHGPALRATPLSVGGRRTTRALSACVWFGVGFIAHAWLLSAVSRAPSPDPPTSFSGAPPSSSSPQPPPRPASPALGVEATPTEARASAPCPCCSEPLGTLAAALASTASIALLAAHDSRGDDIRSVEAATLRECCEACEDQAACVAFAFNQEGGACWMKRAINRVERAAPSIVFGARAAALVAAVSTGTSPPSRRTPRSRIRGVREPEALARDCEATFGDAALDTWRRTARTFCSPTRPFDSALTCRVHKHPLLSKTAGPHTLCNASSIVLDLRHVSMQKCVTFRPEYNCAAEGAGYPAFRVGAWRGDCELATGTRSATDPSAFSGETLAGTWTADHMRSLFSGFSGSTSPSAALPSQLTPGTLLVVTREFSEHANPFHAMTEMFAAFQAARVLGIEPSHGETLLLDGHPPGPFDVLWAKAFSRSGRVLRLQQLLSEHADKALHIPHVVFVPPGYSTFWMTGLQPRICDGQMPVVEDFVRFMLARVGATWASAPGTSDPMRAIFVSRRPYNVFVQHGKFLARQIANEDAVIAGLKSLDGLALRVVDFAHLPTEEQIRAVAAADILIGMHGAGLTHSLWLPPHGALIELHLDRSDWYCFTNIASWRRLGYVELMTSETAPPGRVVRNSTGEYAWVDVPSLLDVVVGMQATVRERLRHAAGVGSAPQR